MNMIYFAFVLLYASYSITSTVRGQICQNVTQLSGEIDGSQSIYGNTVSQCWLIQVPRNSYVRLQLTSFGSNGGSSSCQYVYVKIFVKEAKETFETFCPNDTNRNPVIAFNDVNVTYYAYYYTSSFRLKYTIENLVCAEENHFRCSPDFCIEQYQLCNGVIDCPNGADEIGCETGIMAVKGMNVSRINTINWLKNRRDDSFGWGKNTHRAITALYLSKAMTFQSDDLEEELIAKQLELQTSVALLRNTSHPLSISELSMFVNALAVICHNPRHFYGYNLLQILSDRVKSAKSPVPSAYLTLCNLNWTLSHSDVKNLVNLLHKTSKYSFHIDVQALTVMALTCVRNKTKHFRNIAHAESLYDSTIRKFIDEISDGSIGNVYTTALVTQALLSSGQEENKKWNLTATARYLMKHLNSYSVNFLSVYLTLPIFGDRSLLAIGTVDCSNKRRKEGKDKEISEVTDKLGGKMQIQYSLYIGDEKDVIHDIYLRVPENSSAYDVMRMAQVTDHKFKFLDTEVSGEIYVYEIAGIINDPEAGKFWLLYTGDYYINGIAKQHNESPDKFILGDNDHLIMWYRTAHI